MRASRVRRWGAVAVCAAVFALVSSRAWGSTHAEHASREVLEGVSPQLLVHLLADFSLQPDVGSWSVVEDESSAGSWRYRVTFSCGERCAGEARVAALRDEPHAPRHSRVSLASRRCHPAPLLSWLDLCDESEVQYAVQDWDSGSEVRCSARARCSAWGALVRGAGRCGPRLASLVADTLRRVSAAARVAGAHA